LITKVLGFWVWSFSGLLRPGRTNWEGIYPPRYFRINIPLLFIPLENQFDALSAINKWENVQTQENSDSLCACTLLFRSSRNNEQSSWQDLPSKQRDAKVDTKTEGPAFVPKRKWFPSLIFLPWRTIPLHIRFIKRQFNIQNLLLVLVFAVRFFDF
jgi:hypothetical protein